MLANAAAEGFSWWEMNGDTVIAVTGTLIAALLGMSATLWVAHQAGTRQKQALELQLAHQTAEANRAVRRNAYAEFFALTNESRSLANDALFIARSVGGPILDFLSDPSSEGSIAIVQARDLERSIRDFRARYREAYSRVMIIGSAEVRQVSKAVFAERMKMVGGATNGEDPTAVLATGANANDELRIAMQVDMGVEAEGALRGVEDSVSQAGEH